MRKNTEILICGESDDIKTMRTKLHSYYDCCHVGMLDCNDLSVILKRIKRMLRNVDFLIIDVEHVTVNTVAALAFAMDYDIEICGYYVNKGNAVGRLARCCDLFDYIDNITLMFVENID